MSQCTTKGHTTPKARLLGEMSKGHHDGLYNITQKRKSFLLFQKCSGLKVARNINTEEQILQTENRSMVMKDLNSVTSQDACVLVHAGFYQTVLIFWRGGMNRRHDG